MNRRIRSSLPLLSLLVVAAACSAGTEQTGGSNGSGASGAGGEGTGNGGASAGGSPSTGGSGGNGFVITGGGGTGGGGGSIPVNPCGTECGDVELCDGIHKGLDDNCDGEVDEGCSCSSGQASSCFKGDPSYRDDPGCNPGTMHCTELGSWGPCEGGNHATDNCFASDPMGCHPINGVPFGTVDLSTGTGNFDDNADAGSGMYTVTCPTGVDPCPTPTGTDYSALQSGEYEVTYTKTVNGVPDTCTFPLYVGARGLRVELSWNFGSVDLDLHAKEPMSTEPWEVCGGANSADCGWCNCKSYDYTSNSGPEWFPPGNVPPDPVNWYEDPVHDANTCYFAPRGEGTVWENAGMGCHNPRLDLDDISCSPGVTDPQSSSFCAPENINIDFPPKDQWIRIGVHHFSHSLSGPVFPNVKIFCDGALAADLGTAGFYNPEQPFQWNNSSDVRKYWLVADVLFHEDECVKECIVQPLYLAPDVDAHIPIVLTEAEAESQNGPPYPPIP